MAILLIPIGILLLYVIERWLFSRYWDKGLGVELRFADESVVEGGRSELTEIITNRGFLPLPVVTVSFQHDNGISPITNANVTVSDRTSVVEIFALRFYERITRRLPVECRRRGYYSILSTSVSAKDLIGSQAGHTGFAQNTHLYVFPARIETADLTAPFRQLMGDVVSRTRLYEDPFSFRGIRDYTPLDPPQTINWKASARTGSLRVNEREYSAGQEVCFLLDVEDPALLYDSFLLEDAIKLTYSLAHELTAAHIPVSLITNGSDILADPDDASLLELMAGSSESHMRAMAELLARIDLRRRPGSFAPVLQGLAQDSASDRITYCLIASCQRDDLMEAAQDLAVRHGGITWIAPLSPSMEVKADRLAKVNFVKYTR